MVNIACVAILISKESKFQSYWMIFAVFWTVMGIR